jgi:hypothetical protein
MAKRGILDRRYSNANKSWSEAELETLSDQWGLVSDEHLSRLLGRSPNALHVASVRYLHQSKQGNFYTARNVAQELGVGDSHTIVYWVKKHWIIARPSTVSAGANKKWLFTEEAIIDCLRARPWLCDPKTMPEGYFRSIVREEWAKDRWYTPAEAAPLLGLIDFNAVHRYIYKGWLSAEKKPGGPWQGKWIIRHSSILKFLASDPRPSQSQVISSNRRKGQLSLGLPMRLSICWSVLCKLCGERVLVVANPALKTATLTEQFHKVYTNGHCSHGLQCTLGLVAGPGRTDTATVIASTAKQSQKN